MQAVRPVSTASTLAPLYGRVTAANRQQWVARLRREWQGRLRQLETLDWHPWREAGSHDLHWAARCAGPWRDVPSRRECRILPICPFCHARQSEKIYHRAVQAARFRQDGVFAWRTVSHPLEEFDELLEAISRLSWSRRRHVHGLRPLGGVMYTAVVWGDTGGRIQHRQLFLFESRERAEGIRRPCVSPDSTARTRLFSARDRKRLFRAVVSVGRYEPAWLRGNEEDLASVLAIRKTVGTRLLATYGVFRGKAQ